MLPVQHRGLCPQGLPVDLSGDWHGQVRQRDIDTWHHMARQQCAHIKTRCCRVFPELFVGGCEQWESSRLGRLFRGAVGLGPYKGYE